jgi:hypothetical protein
LAHTFGLGTDAGEHWVIALGALCILSVLVALLWRTYTAARRMTRSVALMHEPAERPTRLVSTSFARGNRHDR